MLVDQLQLWKFLNESTNFDLITVSKKVALEIGKRAQYCILPWFIYSMFMFFNLKSGESTCFQRSEKHITDFFKEWVVKSFRKRPRSGFDRLLNPLVLSLHLNYSLHVEIRRYVKILQTDFCVTMHNQKTSAQSLHSVEYFQRNYVDEGWVQDF